jgi:formimidoylglutamate deiminase
MPQVVFEEALLPQGWTRDVAVSFENGVIGRVEPDAPHSGSQGIAGAGVPGMPNLHSHTFQRAMAGLTERAGSGEDSFWTWRTLMYRFLERLTPDDVAAIAAQAFCEMLEAGFTSCAEFHYLHHAPSGAPYGNLAEMGARIAAAAGETGIGLTLLPVFYAHGGFGGAAPAAGQRRFLNDLESFARLMEASAAAIRPLPDAALGLAPHSLRAATPDELHALLALAGDRPIHIHVAEQQKEVEDCLAWSGRRPVEWLLQEMPVDRRWCLIHATHVTAEETAALAASGGTVGLCPITEANLGDGLFPAVEYRAAQGRFGIGSDSNVLISVAEELRTLEYGQRLSRRRRNLLAAPGASVGRTLYEAALAGGRAALGRKVGAIAPGYRADFVVLDRESPALAGRAGDELLDAWIFAAASSPVREVWVGGRRLVEAGRHVRRGEIFARYRATLSALLS